MAAKITMFTKKNCGDCKRAKFMLEHCPVDVELKEFNIDIDPKFEERLKQMEIMQVPVFEFESGTVIVGFKEGKIMEELGL
ncbi:glutaredoxin family protein [Bacillus sp. FSL K6-0067]|uniref:glutaredoxin family protein n=1 Tax=Bacillus sp. FSL K6-0067 TaxID=2921412 RepID=UPI00077AA867|nr:glutaredoxin family protein [Bacillus cereus]KXY24468.1 NrdH-redoxin [Bacillus cereus]